MFQKILVICEAMPNFNYVLKAVNSLKPIGVQECVLMKCMSTEEMNETISTFVTTMYQSNLEANRQVLLDLGFMVTTREAVGSLKDAVHQIAIEEGCDMVVAGASEKTLFGSLLSSGAADLMLHHARIPLLLVRIPSYPALAELENMKQNLPGHILYPTDFSENANKTFSVLKELVVAGIDKVTLVHVQDKSRVSPHLVDRLEEFNRTDSERLQQLASHLRDLRPVEIHTRLPYGSPTSEVLKIIDENQVTLVVMGSQGRGFIHEIYLGSVSHNIARHSSVSVLLIPADRD